MELIRGMLPNWQLVNGDGYGSGSGYDYGSGYGYSDGYGSGYGYGYGSGEGYGDGDGYGYGSGEGDGYGDGSDYGEADGSSSGNGYGSGDGYGYSDGDGYGYGDGDGYWLAIAQSQYPAIADDNRSIGFWWSDEDGRPSNGGDMPIGVTPGATQRVDGPLRTCSNRALHATVCPPKWEGQRLWIVALAEPIIRNGDKMASLEREILCEVQGDE